MQIGDLLKTIDSSSVDPRLTYFRALMSSTFPKGPERAMAHALHARDEIVYDRVVAQRGTTPSSSVRTRGLSTDTRWAGRVVYNGLGILKSLDTARRIRRVLIIGPGLDLAPRTGFLETSAPQSYQPWAVIDALVSLGLSRVEDLSVVGADINPRVVDHLRQAGSSPPMLTLVTGIAEKPTVQLARD
jgi:hypothetical protein